MNKFTLAAVAFLGSSVAAFAQEMMTDANGMTLYIFDKDTDGVSVCYDDCAVNWPPYLGVEGDEVMADWALVPRTDGTLQWSHAGMPLYYYFGDTAKGDMTGDGLGGVWHIIAE